MIKFLKVLAIIVLIAIVTSLCLDAIGVININDLYNEYNSDETESDVVANNDVGEDLFAGKTYAMTSNMVYTMSDTTPMVTNTSETQSTAIQLVATITPDYATNQSVTWTVDWVDDSATWASGKDAEDYISAEPISTGSKTATVSCIAPFGEQIAITVTSVDNPDASATCVCDYQEQLISFDLNIVVNGTDAVATALDWEVAYKAKVTNVETTAGTIDYTYDSYVSATYVGNSSISSVLSGVTTTGTLGGTMGTAYKAFGVNCAENTYASSNISDSQMNTLQKALYNASSLAVTFSYTMDGISDTVILSIDRDSLNIAVESLTLDQYTITF